MKSIVIFTHAISRGGAEKQGILLAKALQNHYYCIIVTWYGEINEERQLNYVKENNLKVVFLRGSIFSKMLSFCKILKKNNVEIIFSYLTINNIISAICGKLMGIKYVIGGMRNSQMVETKLIINRLLHNYIFEYSVINSFSGYEYFSLRGFKSNKFKIIHNCIELNHRVWETKYYSSNRFNVLTISRFQPQKDLFTAIKSISMFMQKTNVKSFHYYLIGIGDQEAELRNLVNILNLSDYITIIVNPDNLEQYLVNADVYLSTSLYEGLSNSILEAMAFSLPVIATDVGDNKYLVENGVNGYLVDVSSPEKISECLLLLHRNHILRLKFGRMSYQKISNFSIDSFRERYIDLISQLLK